MSVNLTYLKEKRESAEWGESDALLLISGTSDESAACQTVNAFQVGPDLIVDQHCFCVRHFPYWSTTTNRALQLAELGISTPN